ncbi:MAG: NAD(P)H-hydrate dehydratase [Mariprofundaceae bacterium]
MSPILTSKQMSWADRHSIKESGVSGKALMTQAGCCLARAIVPRLDDTVKSRLLIVAGPGNNGGDGFAATRWLMKRKMNIQIILLGKLADLKGDAAAHAAEASQKDIEIIECPDIATLADWQDSFVNTSIIIDAIFGTGLKRPLTGIMAKAVHIINASAVPVLSVDIASGIDSDSGRILGTAVKARWTLPIAACKWGHWLNEGREYAGDILDPARIGISDELITRSLQELAGPADRAQLIDRKMIFESFPGRPRRSHKKDYGHAWIFGGSQGYTGAPRLAAGGAFAVGSGLVSIACPDDVYSVVAASSLEAMIHPQQSAPWHSADSLLAGPGWGMKEQSLLAQLLQSDIPLVLDADGLNMLANDPDLIDKLVGRGSLGVLTPHPGEAARLLGVSAGEVESDRLASALGLADKFGCWIVLKGAETLVVSPQRHVWVCPFGTPRLATAGTGDVLSGMITGLLGQKQAPEKALPTAVALHALAGEQNGWYLAGDLPTMVRKVLLELGV